MVEAAIRSEDLGLVVARMDLLLAEYEHYDLTTDILAAWKHYSAKFYPESIFSCAGDIGLQDGSGEYHPSCRPDFTLRFPDRDYGILAEVKASLSVCAESLGKLAKQISTYCSGHYSFRGSRRNGHSVATPAEQDVLVIVPASSATAAASFLRENLPTPEHNKRVALCQFECKDDATRTLFFNRFPLQTEYEGLRDTFLPKERRLSRFLGSRVELRVEKFELLRKYVIAGNDEMLSGLGVLMKVLEAAKDAFSSQLRRKRHGDTVDPPPLLFGIDELHSILASPPYECCLSNRELRGLLVTYARTAPYFSVDKSGCTATYYLRRARRFHPFKDRKSVV